MKYLNRIVLILLLAMLMVVSLVLAVYSFGIIGLEFLGEIQNNLHGNFSAAISFIVIFVLSAWSLYPLFQRQTGTATISTTEDGQVNISLKAMNKIIREVAYQEEFIEVRGTKVDAKEDGLYARLSISVQEEENIPNLTGRLQHKIKSRLRDITGANVASVEILIENVEGKKDKKLKSYSRKEEKQEEEIDEKIVSESDSEDDPEIEKPKDEEIEEEKISEEEEIINGNEELGQSEEESVSQKVAEDNEGDNKVEQEEDREDIEETDEQEKEEGHGFFS